MHNISLTGQLLAIKYIHRYLLSWLLCSVNTQTARFRLQQSPHEPNQMWDQSGSQTVKPQCPGMERMALVCPLLPTAVLPSHTVWMIYSLSVSATETKHQNIRLVSFISALKSSMFDVSCGAASHWAFLLHFLLCITILYTCDVSHCYSREWWMFIKHVRIGCMVTGEQQ